MEVPPVDEEVSGGGAPVVEDAEGGGMPVSEEDDSLRSRSTRVLVVEDVGGVMVLAVEAADERMVFPELGGSSALERLRVPLVRSRSE